MAGAPSCPKCNGAMEEGFLLDHDHSGVAAQSQWVSGPRERGFWGLKLKGKVRRPVVTWRCRRCGLLESYAGEP